MLEKLLTLVAPHQCLACSREGALLCAPCSQRLPALPPRCYRCLALTPAGKTCRTCRGHSQLFAVQVATKYEMVAKDLVWKLKFGHARAAADDMAAVMAARATFDPETVLVHVPTASSRIRQRGYDQAELLCRSLARLTGLPRRSLLGRRGQARQVGASRQERAEHLCQAFWLKNDQLTGKHIVLVDDVLTTGATLEAAAAALKQAGAKRVEAIVFAQA